MLFAGSIPIGGFLCWGKVWSKCECLSASFVRFFQPWVESILMLTVHKTVVLLVNLILVADSAQRFGCHVAWV